MTTTRFTLLAAVALAGALTACTANTATEPTSTTTSVSASNETPTAGATDTVTPTSGTSTDPLPSTSEVPASSEAPPMTATSLTESTSPVDGFGLAGQDLLNAQAAWSAYERYQDFYKQAQVDPGADWSAQLASLTADPLIVNAQSALSTQFRLGQKIDNQLRVELTSVQAFPNYVLFGGCFDTTATTAQDKDGNDVKAPNAPGSYYRTPGEIEVDSVNGAWLVVDIVFPDRNVSC